MTEYKEDKVVKLITLYLLKQSQSISITKMKVMVYHRISSNVPGIRIHYLRWGLAI